MWQKKTWWKKTLASWVKIKKVLWVLLLSQAPLTLLFLYLLKKGCWATLFCRVIEYGSERLYVVPAVNLYIRLYYSHLVSLHRCRVICHCALNIIKTYDFIPLGPRPTNKAFPFSGRCAAARFSSLSVSWSTRSRKLLYAWHQTLGTLGFGGGACVRLSDSPAFWQAVNCVCF